MWGLHSSDEESSAQQKDGLVDYYASHYFANGSIQEVGLVIPHLHLFYTQGGKLTPGTNQILVHFVWGWEIGLYQTLWQVSNLTLFNSKILIGWWNGECVWPL